MKRTPLKKKSKATPRKLQDKLWVVIKQIVLELYGNDCYTCGAKNLQGASCQLGHMWAKASLSAHLKYDTRVLRIQCFRCNIHLGGQGAVFYARMLKEIGQKEMEKLEKEKQILVKADTIFWQNKLDEAVERLKSVILQGKKG